MGTEAVVCLLYLLVRDEVPSGAIERILRDIGKARRQSTGEILTDFSSPELEAMARRWTKELGVLDA